MAVGARALAGLALVAIVIALVAGVQFSFCWFLPYHWLRRPPPAPGPIVGAGLPILAIGFGAYWLTRQFRHKPD